MSTRYTNDHEWVRIDGDTALIGISNYAQEQLGDIVFVELPEIGKFLKKGDEIAVVESVKAASEVYAPAGGEVVAANSALADDPEKVNAAAETDGWLIRVKLADATDLEPLMDGDAYRAFPAPGSMVSRAFPMRKASSRSSASWPAWRRATWRRAQCLFSSARGPIAITCRQRSITSSSAPSS